MMAVSGLARQELCLPHMETSVLGHTYGAGIGWPNQVSTSRGQGNYMTPLTLGAAPSLTLADRLLSTRPSSYIFHPFEYA